MAYLVSNEVRARHIEQKKNEVCHGKSRQDILELETKLEPLSYCSFNIIFRIILINCQRVHT